MQTKNCKQVTNYMFGRGGLARLDELIAPRRGNDDPRAVFFVDHYFAGKPLLKNLPVKEGDKVMLVDTRDEPKTSGIDDFYRQLLSDGLAKPCPIVGVGGGATLDTAKAVANLLPMAGWPRITRVGTWCECRASTRLACLRCPAPAPRPAAPAS